MMSIAYPFTAIVAQDDMKRALTIAAVDPGIGGVLVLGERGTGKSTTIRALAALLPKIDVVRDCLYQCDPEAPRPGLCAQCGKPSDTPDAKAMTIPVVDLPLGSTEDRVVGALDIERALVNGEKAFQPGLLAQANRGFLYVDEVNLLEDHIVDALLDVAASGENVVEREGLSIRHPAQFVLVGSGNPEEGELRPQLQDRFGLSVDVRTPSDVPTRVDIIRLREAFDQDRSAFRKKWARKESALRRKIQRARDALDDVDTPAVLLETAARLCLALGTDGLRGELTLVRSARALAALEGKTAATLAHLRAIAPSVLRHRLRRDPLDESSADIRVERVITELFEDTVEDGGD
jgi:magnesium chelatase subunit I